MSDDLGPDPAVISDEEAIRPLESRGPRDQEARCLIAARRGEQRGGRPGGLLGQAAVAPSDHETDAAFDAVGEERLAAGRAASGI